MSGMQNDKPPKKAHMGVVVNSEEKITGSE